LLKKESKLNKGKVQRKRYHPMDEIV